MTGKRAKRMLSIIMIFFMTVGIAIHIDSAQIKAQDVKLMPSNPVYDASTDTTAWSYVYFGHYPQTMLTTDEITEAILNADYDDNGDAVIDGVKFRRLKKSDAIYRSRIKAEGFFDWNNIDDYVYFRYDPIRWRVLQNDGEALFLMADTILDCQYYERKDMKINWEYCLMRNWLNAYTPFRDGGFNFLTVAFNEQEENDILTTTVQSPDNPFHGTHGGKTVQDKVFLLSIPEVTDETYGFPSDYKTYSQTRRLTATDYARAKGLWMGTHNDLYDGNAIWLLRTPGSYQNTVAMVYRFGHVYQDGYYANMPYYGVAPALKLSLSSDAWTLAEEDDHTENASVDLIDSLAAARQGYSLDEARKTLLIALQISSGSVEENYIYDVDGKKGVTLNDAEMILKDALGIITLERKIYDNPSATEDVNQTERPFKTLAPPTVTITPTVQPTQEPLTQTQYDASGTIWLAADSIADYHSKSSYSQPLYGWGELIGQYFSNSATANFQSGVDSSIEQKAREEGAKVFINNTALSSRSCKSFTKESNYLSITEKMSKGDYLLISFGHNDERACLDLYSDPFGSSSDERSFKWFLKNYYIDPAIRAGAQPVLISPVTRRYFYQHKFVKPQLHTPYADAMKELSEEYAKQGITVYYIDLHYPMLEMYERLGEEGTAALHGKYGNTYDHTHLSLEGSTWVCERIVEQMKEQNMNIATFLK